MTGSKLLSSIGEPWRAQDSGLLVPIQAKRSLLNSPTDGWMNACHWINMGEGIWSLRRAVNGFVKVHNPTCFRSHLSLNLYLQTTVN